MRVLLMALGISSGLLGASGVALAAIGAHVSGNPTVTTAAYFLLFHAAALAAFCAMARDTYDPWLLAAGTLIVLGAILFSGDLALRALAHVTLVHMAAPIGGVLMIVGWLAAAIAIPLCLRRQAP